MVRSGEKADRSAERTPLSWAALAAALAVTAGPATALAQTTPQPVEAGAGAGAQTDRVQLEADEIIDDQQGRTITARGDVQVHYQGRTMRAEELVYNLDTGVIRASGNVEIVLPDGTVTYAEQVEADEDLNIAVASELRARLGTEGTLVARAAFRHGEGESELRNIVYTSCPLCADSNRPPTWALRARRAIQDRETRTISYQGAVLEVVGAPIFYLPYFAHPDPSVGRTSGFLPPNIGRNRRLGAHYTQPYYWAISPFDDATVFVRAHQNVNPLFGVDYRRRFWSGRVNVSSAFTQEREFDGNGERFGEDLFRGALFANGRFRVDNYWEWGFGAERVTDDLFIARYEVEGAGEVRGPYIGNDTRLASQLFAIGQDARSYTATNFISLQGIRSFYTPDLLPNVLPMFEAERVFTDPILDGQLRVQTSAVVLQRDKNPVLGNTARFSLGATWRRDYIAGPGIVFSPFAQARGDVYRVEPVGGSGETISRGLGLAGAEISWPFMRSGERWDFVIEPVVTAAYASENAADPRIVNEDSLGFELDNTSLFRPNGAPNYDLWEPGGRISAGIRATARARTGQTASLVFGRRWREEPAPGFTPRSNLNQQASDYVGSVNVNLGRVFSTDARFRLDSETLAVQRIDLGVSGAISRFSLGARYYRIEESFAPGLPNEQVSFMGGVDLARGWRLTGFVNRDLQTDINLRQGVSAIYEDDCTFLEIAYTRTETQIGTLGPDESIQIRIGLRSLGVFSGQ